MLKLSGVLKSPRFLLAAALAASLSACALPPKDDPEALAEFEAANDPFEPVNRHIFAVNVMIDQLALQPATVTYRDLFPDKLKPPVRNFITNLFMPVSFVHALLQGDLDRADRAAQRFVSAIPTLLLANTMPDDEPVVEDAGQTLGVWGFEEGPYVMLPLLGPSSLRDSFGLVADVFLDPLGWVASSDVTIGRSAGNAVLLRANNLDQVRDLQRTSLDYYAAVRSLYHQQREAQIRNGLSAPIQPAPTLGRKKPKQPDNQETAAGN